ncbi:MAG: helix-turn-helix domain-containing protein [bacterium]|nr:helix-turn-helix domain-containing protein [bacterium]
MEFPSELKQWRSRRGVSQLALALEAGVSAKHLSFLETGRARPSRPMVLRLAEALDLPLRERNGFLLSAGFAPRFGARPLTSGELDAARYAVRLMLECHEPNPAFALDRYWDVVSWNRPLATMLGPLTSDGVSIGELNALDLVFKPGLQREQFLNWDEVAGAVLRRLQRQVARAGSDERLRRIWDEVRQAPGVSGLLRGEGADETPPVLVPMRLRQGDGVLSWINTLATFGATSEVTLDELVVESFFPADEDTRRFVEENLVADPPPGPSD